MKGSNYVQDKICVQHTCSSKHSASLEVKETFVSSSGAAANIDVVNVLLFRHSRHSVWKLAIIKESSILCTTRHETRNYTKITHMTGYRLYIVFIFKFTLGTQD